MSSFGHFLHGCPSSSSSSDDSLLEVCLPGPVPAVDREVGWCHEYSNCACSLACLSSVLQPCLAWLCQEIQEPFCSFSSQLLYWEIYAYTHWVKEQLWLKLLVAEADCAASDYLNSVRSRLDLYPTQKKAGECHIVTSRNSWRHGIVCLFLYRQTNITWNANDILTLMLQQQT